MAFNWYVLQVMSGWEQKVKENLEKRIPLDHMEPYIKQVIIPTENVSEVKAGKKRISKRKFFPGYIIVEMEVNDDSYYFITQTNGVIRFGGDTQPIPLLDHEVEGIIGQMEGKKEKVKPKVHFEKGESVKITDGPFVNFNGTVDEVNPDKGKLKVMVLIFGRATSVELEYWQVERV